MSDEIKGRQKKAATDTAVKKRSNSQQLVKKQLKKPKKRAKNQLNRLLYFIPVLV
ncbi:MULTISPECIES: hypothetical protein [Pseudoalteromonas]|uniref:hypothetical protein n=1 Tax=Pseudoalteromonas TaxID=53246 RepID=UPI0012FE0932|nr:MULTISPECIES: hypothetical protein [Pseudoalteromonas]